MRLKPGDVYIVPKPKSDTPQPVIVKVFSGYNHADVTLATYYGIGEGAQKVKTAQEMAEAFVERVSNVADYLDGLEFKQEDGRDLTLA